MNHRPVAIGLLLCEQAIVEDGTRNITPVNCFNLRVLDDTYEEIYRIEKTLVFPDRLQDTRFLARIRSCTLPVEGHCQISLSIEGEWIAHRKFRVQKKGIQK